MPHEMIPLLVQVGGTMFGAVFASAGFWAYLSRRDADKDARTHLLLGLAYDRIAHVGVGYIERGWLTKDEYKGFLEYLYKPYVELGGNGLAKKIADEVAKLPICNKHD
nr:MAG TPA: holin protein [Caudoviricetes sp.]